MSTAVDPKEASAKFENEVDRQIAQATSRIRLHDVLVGVLILGSLVALYAAVMIGVDKAYALPDAVRQGSLVGFAALLAVVGYFAILRPLRRRVNPLYAAVQVERTIEDAKNSVAGYVELKERELNPHVRTALGARAAQAVGEADLNRAVNHKSLVYFGYVFGASILALVVLLVLFRPAQFLSLLGRAFNPFNAGAIATRTQVMILVPEGGDATVTSNTSMQISVHVSGRVPAETEPDRVRALLRYSATEPGYEELPLVRGSNKHEWSVQVPPHLVQNGFWYRIAAGDAETAEYRVTVRTVPQFLGFDMQYEYPAYLRIKPDSVTDSPNPDLYGYRGTKVLLTARANREVRDGTMEVMPGQRVIAGERVPGRPDALRFKLTLQESGTFKLGFTAVNDERSRDGQGYKIDVISDQAPLIEILQPKEESITLPLNGRLAVDASIADDFGIDGAILRLRLKGEKPIPLAPKFFNEGKSFRRVADDTFPRDFAYKDSVDLAAITDEAGKKPKLEVGSVIEYWLEATDNQEPKPNLGKSKVQTVTLGPTIEEQAKQAQKKERDQQERANRQAEQQRMDGEKRAPKAGPNQKPEPGAAGEPMGQKNEGPEGADPKPMNEGDPQKGQPQGEQPKKGEPQKGEQPKGEQPQAGDPKPKDKQPNDDASKQGGEQGEPGQAGETKKGPSEDQIKKDAERAKEALNEEQKNRKSAGEGKPNETPEAGENAEPGEKRQEQPSPEGKTEPRSESKEGDQPKGTPNDKGTGGEGASQPKSEGKLQPPPEPSTQKEGPKPDEKPGAEPGAENKPGEAKSEPVGAPAGKDKETPEPKPENNDAKAPKEPKDQQPQDDGGKGKSAGAQRDSGDMNEKTDPSETAARQKPQPDSKRGEDKPSGEKKPQSGKESSGSEKQEGGEGKGESSSDAASAKQPPPEGGEERTESKSSPDQQGGEPSEQKPDSGGQSGQPQGDRGSSKKTPEELAREIGRERKGSNDDGSKPESRPDPKDAPERLLRDKDKFKQTAQDLNSKDDQTRQNAEDQMDKAVGKDGRQAAKDAARGLDSPMKDQQEKAEEDLDQLRKKKDKEAEARKQEAEEKEQQDELAKKKKGDKDELAKKAKDLNSKDDAAREKAEQDLDKSVGQQDRQDLQQKMKDADGGTPEQKQAAADKIDELAKKQSGGQAGKDDQQPKPTKEQIDDMKKTLEDLASGEDDKRKAAEQKLDQQVGKQNRDKLQQAMKDMKDNPEKAKETLEKMAKDAAEQMAKKDGEKDKGLSPEEVKDLAVKLADLNSKDEQKRKEAEKEFDKKLGEEKRKELQNAMKKKEPGEKEPTEQELADLKKKLEEMAKAGPGKDRDPRGNKVPPGGVFEETADNKPADADPKNRLKSAELQLEQFKDKQFDREFLKKIGKNEEEYRQFLRGYEEMVGRMREEAAQAEKAAAPVAPTANVGSGGAVEARSGVDSAATSGGASVAPPGFSDAKKKFGAEAIKARPQPK